MTHESLMTLSTFNRPHTWRREVSLYVRGFQQTDNRVCELIFARQE